jgi:hypothetical protein
MDRTVPNGQAIGSKNVLYMDWVSNIFSENIMKVFVVGGGITGWSVPSQCGIFASTAYIPPDFK